MDIDKAINKIKDFPKPGILFYDITSIFTNPEAFKYVIDKMMEKYENAQIDGVIGVESRGFLLAAPFALRKKLPLVLARKEGKLPGETIGESYDLEYGSATLEVHVSDLKSNKRYLIVDDLLATGGTLEAVGKLVERQNAEVVGIFSIVGLPFLDYDEKIGKYDPYTLINYESE